MLLSILPIRMLLSILLLKDTNLKVSHDYSIKTMNFIKLTNIVINPSKIITIYMSPTLYRIQMQDSTLNGIVIFGNGGLSSANTFITVHKQNTVEYDIITDWINKHSQPPS